MPGPTGPEGWEKVAAVLAATGIGLAFLSNLTLGNCPEILGKVTDGAVALGELILIIGVVVVGGTIASYRLERRTKSKWAASFNGFLCLMGLFVAGGGLAVQQWALRGATEACVNGLF